MPDRRETHFFGALGAMCGAEPPYHWSMNEARTTCRACRRMLRAGAGRAAGPPAREPEPVLDPRSPGGIR